MKSPFNVLSHAQASSTGTADVQTLAAPAGAKGVYLTATTTLAYITFDGTTPSATNGVPLPTAGSPVLFLIAKDIQFASSAAAASLVNAVWLA